MANPPETTLRDRTQLRTWMEGNPTGKIEARSANLAGIASRFVAEYRAERGEA